MQHVRRRDLVALLDLERWPHAQRVRNPRRCWHALVYWSKLGSIAWLACLAYFMCCLAVTRQLDFETYHSLRHWRPESQVPSHKCSVFSWVSEWFRNGNCYPVRTSRHKGGDLPYTLPVSAAYLVYWVSWLDVAVLACLRVSLHCCASLCTGYSHVSVYGPCLGCIGVWCF